MTMCAEKTSIVANPFVKWAGGKSQLLKYLIDYMPKRYNDYIEAFVGGGALFFRLYSNGVLEDKKAVLIDSNSDLLNVYKILKNAVKLEKLMAELKCGKYENTEKNFYSIRAESPTKDIESAARMVYLNKTCFNGLYRVNSKGKFNTPYGRYNNPNICNAVNFNAVNCALKNTKIVEGDFSSVLNVAKENDFVYFDPPYQPVSKTASFTGYTKNSFNENDQARLAEVYKTLDKRGCKLMLSNSDAGVVKDLYKNFRIEIVKAKRVINCKAAKRGTINELIILNY